MSESYCENCKYQVWRYGMKFTDSNFKYIDFCKLKIIYKPDHNGEIKEFAETYNAREALCSAVHRIDGSCGYEPQSIDDSFKKKIDYIMRKKINW